MRSFILMHEVIETYLTELLERNPRVGYVLASVPTGTSATSLLMDAKNVLTYVSLVLGIIVALYAWRANHLNVKKLQKELELLNKRRDD